MKCFRCNNIIEGIYKNKMQMPIEYQKDKIIHRVFITFPNEIPLCNKCKCETIIEGLQRIVT